MKILFFSLTAVLFLAIACVAPDPIRSGDQAPNNAKIDPTAPLAAAAPTTVTQEHIVSEAVAPGVSNSVTNTVTNTVSNTKNGEATPTSESGRGLENAATPTPADDSAAAGNSSDDTNASNFIVVDDQQPFQLAIGQKTKVKNDLEIKFVAVEQDSRCPPDVDCVWEGEVVFLLDLKTAAEDLGQFTLSTVRNRTVKVSDYVLEVTAVDPPPAKSGGERSPDIRYIITLKIQ